ncbi:unnamed protein product [Arabidopsis lyrata]|nr:unnamed protein product [Arabidopsis lyrata]
MPRTGKRILRRIFGAESDSQGFGSLSGCTPSLIQRFWFLGLGFLDFEISL